MALSDAWSGVIRYRRGYLQGLGTVKGTMDKSNNMPVTSRDSRQGKWLDPCLVFILILFHGWACFRLLPPGELIKEAPLFAADHPAHAHRVETFRQGVFARGVPWGYDPGVSAGMWRHPAGDAGARPQQILGVLMPFLYPGAVVRLFLMLSALLFPLWTYLAVKNLGLDSGVGLRAVALLLLPAWLYVNISGFFSCGIASFAFAGYFSPLILALFLKFLGQPSWKTYFAALSSLAFDFLLHPLGPVVVAVPLLLLTVFSRSLSPVWRIRALLAPLGAVIVNAFWLIPFIRAFSIPRGPWEGMRMVSMDPDLLYVNWETLGAAVTLPRAALLLAGLGVVSPGFYLLKEKAGGAVAWGFFLAVATGLLLKFFGSFVPAVARMQPARFLLPAVAFAAVPAGVFVHHLEKHRKAEVLWGASALVVFLSLLTAGTRGGAQEHRIYSGRTVSVRKPVVDLPPKVPIPGIGAPLKAFVDARTEAEERLLIQTRIQAEQRAMAVFLNREVLGNSYSDVTDPTQFLENRLWGRELSSWNARDLRSALERWGVNWVFTGTREAARLFEEALGGEEEKVGGYRVFRVPGAASRFLLGNGRIRAEMNRLVLSDLVSEGGLVVIKYRFHPAWEGADLLRFPVPEDPSGFIALREPPESLVLDFNPWAMFSRKWPNHISLGRRPPKAVAGIPDSRTFPAARLPDGNAKTP